MPPSLLKTLNNSNRILVFDHINPHELFAGPNLPAGAHTRTAPPGGDSPPSPGAGFGDGPSERQSAASGAGAGEQGEGPSPEGQMPGRAGILICSEKAGLCLSASQLSPLCVFSVTDSERAAGPGDQKTTGLLPSDAATRRVGREACGDVVALPAALSASQRPHVTSGVHIRTRTQHKHALEAPAHAHVHGGLH